MLLKTETYQHQKTLAEYCRNGKEITLPGAITERLPHYRRLVFNIVNDSLESAFPIAFKYVERVHWNEMVVDFFSNHKCTDPQVWRMPFEFYGYVVEKEFHEKYSLPWLNDLLYFEWLEVELYMMEDIQYPLYKDSENWLGKLVAVNPEHKLIKLKYPIHKMNPKKAKENKGDHFLLLFRQKDSGKVQFVGLSTLYVFILENIFIGTKKLDEILNDVLYFFGINDMELLQKNTHSFLTDLKSKGFVLGIYK